MTDIYNTTILCEDCNRKTTKGFITKNGYKIRTWECDSCHKRWFHPLDLQEYNNFEKIKHKEFKVKLRFVGNSYAVSIPREIIDFQEEISKEIDKILYMSLEEPEKLSIFFSKRIKKILNNK
ncbi:hypothetical protein J4449_03350 [Candidatus Woesearchaeota archaeon]|nr:hypothetical protein [Candidatus Woesearchaeota archaeon]